jgi:hypothetical protein
MPHFIIDAHLELSVNCDWKWTRDLRLPVKDINEREKNLTDINQTAEKELFLFPCIADATEISVWWLQP